jgi:NAD(P)-dependent dehydrogenase (short-subunit alcohol dehydrogenase family)
MKKNILITGFTCGIGLSLIESLIHRSDVCLHLVARDSSKIDKFQAEYSDYETFIHKIDVLDESSVDSLFSHFKNKKIHFTSIITLVGSHAVKPIRISNKNDYMKLFESNFISVSNILSNARSVIESGGSIVTVGSAAIGRGSALVSAYVAAKSALTGYVRSAALEFADLSVRVNCIHPGVVITEGSNAFISKLNEEAKSKMIERHPLGLGRPSDVSGLIEFLISDKSRWLTGQSIFIDGGFSISA